METGIEQHWRVNDVAERLGVSPKTVRRLFEDRPGVRIIGDRTGTRTKRPYKTLLIPESLLQKVKKELE